MKIVKLIDGVDSFVDDEDYTLVIKYNWRLSTYGYAISCVIHEQTYMHLYILSLHCKYAPIGHITDHEDRNKLNNQKENFRFVTHSQNQANSGLQKNNISGYKGVSYHYKARKYAAYIKCNYKRKHLGLFDNAIDAAVAYDKAAILAFGEFAWTNFPRNNYVLFD